MISRIARVGRVARAGGAGTPAFDPTILTAGTARYISGPTYEFTDAPPGTVAVGDTGQVQTWRDNTASAFHLTQATAASRPIANLTSGVWRTTGDGTAMQIDNAGAVALSNAAGFSMALAFLPTTSAGVTEYIVRLRDSGTGDMMSLLKSSASKLTGEFRTSTGVKSVASAASITTATPCCAIWSVDTLLAYTHRLNGVQLTGTLAGAFTGITANTINLFSANAVQWFPGSIFEVICRNAPFSAGEITSIEAYFHTAYGTP